MSEKLRSSEDKRDEKQGGDSKKKDSKSESIKESTRKKLYDNFNKKK